VSSTAKSLADFKGQYAAMTSGGFIYGKTYIQIFGTEPTELDTGLSLDDSPGVSLVAGTLEPVPP
jgi:hypothetical protein